MKKKIIEMFQFFNEFILDHTEFFYIETINQLLCLCPVICELVVKQFVFVSEFSGF